MDITREQRTIKPTLADKDSVTKTVFEEPEKEQSEGKLFHPTPIKIGIAAPPGSPPFNNGSINHKTTNFSQKTYGNLATLRYFRYPMQAKLNIGQPDDQYEQEADTIADQVMRMPDPLVQTKSLSITPLVQRQTNEEETLHTKGGTSHTPNITPNIESNINSLNGGGKPLDPATQAYFEPRFDYDFSQVRVHTGSSATESARAINAKAFTLGQDVVLGTEHYSSDSPDGTRLLAHELTHVIQQRGGANAEASLQKTTIWRKSVVTQAAHKPETNTSLAAIQTELLEKYPWLKRIIGYEKILAQFSQALKNRRRIQKLGQEFDKIAKSILSEDVDRAEALRHEIGELSAQNNLLYFAGPIDVLPLLHKDVFPDPSQAKADAGKMALVQDLGQRKGYLEVGDPYCRKEEPERVTLYLYPGWDTAVTSDGIHYAELMSNESLNLLVVQKALIEEALRTWDEFVARTPQIKVELAKLYLAEAKAAALEPPPKSQEEAEISEIISERKRYAADIQQTYVEAGAVPAAILELFVPDGPVDLLLMVVPVHKLGEAGKLGRKLYGIFRSRRKLKIATKEVTQFLETLDKEGHVFLRLVERLPKTERAAVKILHAQGATPALIKNLMVRVTEHGTAEISWIAKMLEKGKMDIKFVERFSLYEGHPRWDLLQKVIDKSGEVLAEERTQLMRVMKGLLGEEAAIKMLKKEGMELLEAGYRYGGNKSLDIVAATKKGKFLFGEVKNWAVGTWSNTVKRASVIEQLAEHEAGIQKFLRESAATAQDIERKVLMVEEKGFLALDDGLRIDFIQQVESLNWKIELLPKDSIESIPDFIKRLR